MRGFGLVRVVGLSAFALLTSSTAVRAQSAVPVAPAPAHGEAGFVEMLIDVGLPVEASREANRLAIAHGTTVLTPAAAFRLGMALAMRGEAQLAVPFIVQAANRSDDTRVADDWQITAAVVLLRSGSFPQAFHLLARVEAFGSDPLTRSRATQFRCVGHALALDAPAARQCISNLPASQQPDSHRVSELLADLESNPRRSAFWGAALSTVLPGLGQLTAGNPWDATVALLVNGAWTTSVYLLVTHAAIVEAVLLGVGVGARYYFGNIRNGARAWQGAATQRATRAAETLVRLLANPNPTGG